MLGECYGWCFLLYMEETEGVQYAYNVNTYCYIQYLYQKSKGVVGYYGYNEYIIGYIQPCYCILVLHLCLGDVGYD